MKKIRLLKFDKAIGVNDLDRYETKALAIRSEIGQYIMQALVTGHQTETTEKKNCAECQTPLISKGRIRRCWYSLAGLVQIFKHKRICPNCKTISYFDPVKNAESMIWLRAKYYEGHWESFWMQVSLKRLWENELMLADVA